MQTFKESPVERELKRSSPSVTDVPRRLLVGLLVGVVLLGLFVGIAGSLYLLNRPTRVAPKEVTVQKGMTVAQIATLLHREHIIRSPRLLRFFSMLSGTSRRLTAGVHPFHGRMTTWQVLKELEVPRDVTRDVTLPEGLRKEQVAGILSDALDLEGDKLLYWMSDSLFCRELGIQASTLEGYLFPETYKVSLTMDEKQVVRLMVGHFFRVFDRKMDRRAAELGLTRHQAVTLASIIEGEAQLDGERPVVSAVYHNRLKRRMRLQADPTVQYALPDGPRRLFNRDYLLDSPYNTYRHHGLPPGPIMNPGRASLRAALFPADIDYLYFVARGDGSHVFTRTSEEHERARRETRRARRNLWRQSTGKK